MALFPSKSPRKNVRTARSIELTGQDESLNVNLRHNHQRTNGSIGILLTPIAPALVGSTGLLRSDGMSDAAVPLNGR